MYSVLLCYVLLTMLNLVLLYWVHCKKRLSVFPSPAGISLTNFSLEGNNFIYSRPGRVQLVNYSRPGRVWLVTSWLGLGKPLTFFYSVEEIQYWQRPTLFFAVVSLGPPPSPLQLAQNAQAGYIYSLSAHMENALNGGKSVKIKHILVYNRTP